jgi:hypothetical protein
MEKSERGSKKLREVRKMEKKGLRRKSSLRHAKKSEKTLYLRVKHSKIAKMRGYKLWIRRGTKERKNKVQTLHNSLI